MASRRPRIGITCTYRVKDVARGIPRVEIASNYTDAISAAGGVPILLVPQNGDGRVEDYCELIDGLLLTGGPDVSPARYGAEPRPETKVLPALREEFDFAMFRAVRRAGKPILGVCLGQQVINVALGGTLLQHLPEEISPYTIEHRAQSLEHMPPRHDVEIFPKTRLAAVIGAEHVSVNSSHHQAVAKIAPGLRQTAAAPDGIVEGLEGEESDQILAVQWHPEFLTDEAPHRALFEDLVKRARHNSR
jgi:putative glutamine amidotransferase